MLHKADMVEAFRRTIDRRAQLPAECAMLIGERDPLGYDALQDEIGYLIHGVDDWPTLRVPRRLAATGAWGLAHLEPLIPDAIDQGEEPFIRPFMAMMGNDHYALDTTKARQLLGWENQHTLKGDLPAIIAEMKRDPVGWYQRHRISRRSGRPPLTRSGATPKSCAPCTRSSFAASMPVSLGAFREYRSRDLADDVATAARRRAGGNGDKRFSAGAR